MVDNHPSESIANLGSALVDNEFPRGDNLQCHPVKNVIFIYCHPANRPISLLEINMRYNKSKWQMETVTLASGLYIKMTNGNCDFGFWIVYKNYHLPSLSAMSSSSSLTPASELTKYQITWIYSSYNKVDALVCKHILAEVKHKLN